MSHSSIFYSRSTDFDSQFTDFGSHFTDFGTYSTDFDSYTTGFGTYSTDFLVTISLRPFLLLVPIPSSLVPMQVEDVKVTIPMPKCVTNVNPTCTCELC